MKERIKHILRGTLKELRESLKYTEQDIAIQYSAFKKAESSLKHSRNKYDEQEKQIRLLEKELK